MKKLSNLLMIAVIMLSSVVFTSCASKEERNIANLRDLVEKVETKGADMNEDEWKEVIDKHNTIVNEDSKDCNYTDEQLKEIATLEVQFTVACAKFGAKKIGNGLKNAVKQAGDFVDGFVDGLKSE